MSRYIDAEAWLKNIECTNKFLDTLKHKMTDAPSIDIVRCKECKYGSDNKVYGCMCDHFNDNDWSYHRMYADDFCSYGERKSDEY